MVCQDDAALGGPDGPDLAKDIVRTSKTALASGFPIVTLHYARREHPRSTLGGLRVQAELLDIKVRCSGIVPQISVVLNEITGLSTFGVGLADLTVLVEGQSEVRLFHPEAVRTITAEVVTAEDLGGVLTQSTLSGLAHLVAVDEPHSMDLVRYLLSFFPSNNLESAPFFEPTDASDQAADQLEDLLPDSVNIPYDVVDIIRGLVDDGETLELQPAWGRSLATAFGRLGGQAVGIVANQPSELAGTLDTASSIKGARFVRFCDAFNIPLLALVDTPGFRPGISEEFDGIIRHGSKLVYAFAQATVPRVTLIMRKAYGGAYIVMNSKHIRADLLLAWPTGEIAVMGAEGAVKIIHRRETARSSDPGARERQLVDEYRTIFMNPYAAAERGFVDAVVRPSETRRALLAAFEMLRGKREAMPPRKHGNIPL